MFASLDAETAVEVPSNDIVLTVFWDGTADRLGDDPMCGVCF